MDRVIAKPPRLPAWNYDGTNWSTIESEVDGMGWTIDGDDNGDGTVTLHTIVIDDPTDVTVNTGDWLMPQGGDRWSVLDDEAFNASFEVVATQVVLDRRLF